MIKSFRSTAFCTAWDTYNNRRFKTFGVALANAWRIYRLKKKMREGVVQFAYIKADGTFRLAKGTLKDIPSNVFAKTKKPRKFSSNVPYWDVEAAAFRSFDPVQFMY